MSLLLPLVHYVEKHWKSLNYRRQRPFLFSLHCWSRTSNNGATTGDITPLQGSRCIGTALDSDPIRLADLQLQDSCKQLHYFQSSQCHAVIRATILSVYYRREFVATVHLYMHADYLQPSWWCCRRWASPAVSISAVTEGRIQQQQQQQIIW